MPRPVKLRDLLAAIREADPEIKFFEERGKGSHAVLCKDYPEGCRSLPIPTSSGEVLGPYQSKIIALFELPKDVFEKGKKAKASRKAQAKKAPKKP
jgi:hypothetical protein